MSDTNICPCGSEGSYENCCLPVIQGKRSAQTAEELLRARYTSFVKGELDFIRTSHHSRTRDQMNWEEAAEWSKNSKWLGLKIHQIEAGKKTDDKGTIIFEAHYHAEGKDHQHLEKSFFEKENGEWRFLDAQGIAAGTYRRQEPKVGRNDPCTCGSGKKYKKCCGLKNAI